MASNSTPMATWAATCHHSHRNRLCTLLLCPKMQRKSCQCSFKSLYFMIATNKEHMYFPTALLSYLSLPKMILGNLLAKLYNRKKYLYFLVLKLQVFATTDKKYLSIIFFPQKSRNKDSSSPWKAKPQEERGSWANIWCSANNFTWEIRREVWGPVQWYW